MPGVINQAAQQLVWTAKYWRHHGLYEEEFDSLEEAVRFLEHGEDYGDLSSDSIVGPDGLVVHDFNVGGMGNNIWAYAEHLRSSAEGETSGEGVGALESGAGEPDA